MACRSGCSGTRRTRRTRRKKSLSGSIERLHLSFERFADTLTETLDVEGASDAEQSLLIEEVKVGCTLAMLQCLDRPHRLAYVLGEIMELSGPEAAEALDISPDLFRKRLQHARATVVSFTKAYCGLASDAAPCRCNRQVAGAVRDPRRDRRAGRDRGAVRDRRRRWQRERDRSGSRYRPMDTTSTSPTVAPTPSPCSTPPAVRSSPRSRSGVARTRSP